MRLMSRNKPNIPKIQLPERQLQPVTVIHQQHPSQQQQEQQSPLESAHFPSSSSSSNNSTAQTVAYCVTRPNTHLERLYQQQNNSNHAVVTSSPSSSFSPSSLCGTREQQELILCEHLRRQHQLSQQQSFFTASQILPHVFLGSYDDAASVADLRRHGIKRVLNVAQECTVPSEMQSHGSDVQVLHLLLKDHSDENISLHLKEGIEFMHEGVVRGEAVLVHCRMGISRSATFVIAYLMTYGTTESLQQTQQQQTQQQQTQQQQQTPTQQQRKEDQNGLSQSTSPASSPGSLSDEEEIQPEQQGQFQQKKQFFSCLVSTTSPSVSSVFCFSSSLHDAPQNGKHDDGDANCHKNHNHRATNHQSFPTSPTVTCTTSIAAAATATIRIFRMSYQAAYELVKSARPHVSPNFGFTLALHDLDEKLQQLDEEEADAEADAGKKEVDGGLKQTVAVVL